MIRQQAVAKTRVQSGPTGGGGGCVWPAGAHRTCRGRLSPAKVHGETEARRVSLTKGSLTVPYREKN